MREVWCGLESFGEVKLLLLVLSQRPGREVAESGGRGTRFSANQTRRTRFVLYPAT